jgi:ferredoxin--NADP+ reductase
MVDGTGMCGGCRVIVNNEAKFACVDGPEFDAHLVDFKVLISRNNMYREMELKSLEMMQNPPMQTVHSEAECKLMAAHPEIAPGKKA